MANLLTSLNSAAAALNTYQRAMQVVQNDTVNATTPGYVRQTAVFQAQPFNWDGSQPGGVALGAVLSSRDEYAERNVQLQQTAFSESSTLAEQLSNLQPVFDLQSTTGVAGRLDSLFASFSQLTVSPNDAQTRQSVLNAASNLATAINVASKSFDSASQTAALYAENSVKNLNSVIADIQSLNVELRRQAGGTSDPSLDARLYVDLEQLASYAGVTSIRAQDGTVSIYLGGQRPLLIGTTQYELSVSSDSTGTRILDSSGNDATSAVSGGKLGALLSIRNTLMPEYKDRLDQLASTLADTINNQLAAGLDQNGNTGAALFTYNSAAPAQTLAITSITTSQLAASSAGATGSNANAIALSGLQTATFSALGGFTFTQYFGDMSSTLGRTIQNADDDQTTQQNLLAQARSIRSDVSSVSLDEEAARLIEYQRAYEATSKLFTVIDSMTQTLLDMIPS